MGFQPSTKPFDVENLTDLISEEVLELIQLGFGKQQSIPMTLIEKRGNKYVRIPKGEDFQPWTSFCVYLRGFEKGNELCKLFDQEKAKEVFDQKIVSPKKYFCHAGLVDICIPIIIGGKLLAVFLGGQKRSQGSDDELLRSISNLSNKIPGLDKETLKRNAIQVEELSENKFDEYTATLSKVVGHITELAKSSYETRRRLHEELFLDEVITYFMSEYGEARRSVHNVIHEILEGFNKFANISTSIFLYEQDKIPAVVMSQQPLEPSIEELLSCVNQISKTDIILTRSNHKDKVELHYLSKDFPTNEALRKINVSINSSIFMSKMSFTNNTHGYFIFIEDGKNNSFERNNEYLEEKVRFLEDFVSHIREQINSFLVDEEESDLVAGLAHQLRSPMNSMLGRCWNLRMKCKNAVEQLTTIPGGRIDPKIKKNLIPVFEDINPIVLDIEDYVKILKYKTENLLYFSVNERGPIEFEFRLWSITTILRDRISHFRSQGAKYGKNIRLNVGIDSDKKIMIDRNKMEIVFDNLLENAIKYSHSNKDIYVSTMIDEESDHYIIKVDNFGLAIMPEEKELIFKRYYRSKMVRDSRRQISGTGIGLAVSLSIVEGHGGKIKVESRRGVGESSRESIDGEGYRTIFTVEIPLSRKEL